MMATRVAVSEGFVKVTEGAVVSVPAPVEKGHTKLLARGKPPTRLCAAVVIVAVKVVLAAKLPPVGANIAMLLIGS